MTEEAQGGAVRDLRILLVEDNKFLKVAALRQLAQIAGVQVDAVDNGLEALEALPRAAYDLVLMDCQMPEMDGFEATAEIRKREAGGKRLPVIALTASAEDREKCLASGMDEVLTKPVASAALKSCIEKWGRAQLKPAA
ncbi:MAG: response regulator [Elusimicrobia bacterium]|nr:response regulator [Elusimicrobiota bacterium]